MTTHHTQPLPVKLRVEGFPTDIAAFVEALRRAPGVRLLDCSRPYHNRRGNPARVRHYLEVTTNPTDSPTTSTTTVTEVGPPALAPPPPPAVE